MNIFFKMYCRVIQTCFHLALPVMPYRFPVQLDSLSAVADLLKEKDKKKVLSLVANVLPGFIDECFEEAGVKREEVDHVFPHQASKALPMIMKRTGFKEGTYVNKVTDYGNMISAAIPYVFCEAIENGEIKRGESCLLVGTAAGLTISYLLLKF